MKTYQDIHKHDINVDSFNFLVVTTTEVETQAFHDVFVEPVNRIAIGDYTYYLGRVGNYNVINVQCLQMGSMLKETPTTDNQGSV